MKEGRFHSNNDLPYCEPSCISALDNHCCKNKLLKSSNVVSKSRKSVYFRLNGLVRKYQFTTSVSNELLAKMVTTLRQLPFFHYFKIIIRLKKHVSIQSKTHKGKTKEKTEEENSNRNNDGIFSL